MNLSPNPIAAMLRCPWGVFATPAESNSLLVGNFANFHFSEDIYGRSSGIFTYDVLCGWEAAGCA